MIALHSFIHSFIVDPTSHFAAAAAAAAAQSPI
jgi:hypothetical protein